jgi:hypothetical protein
VHKWPEPYGGGRVSARKLARRLALRMYDGTLTQLPRFAESDNPLRVRACLQAYYRLHDVYIAERAALIARQAPLDELFAVAGVQGEIDDAIVSARSLLTRVARRGGRGFDVLTEASP